MGVLKLYQARGTTYWTQQTEETVQCLHLDPTREGCLALYWPHPTVVFPVKDQGQTGRKLLAIMGFSLGLAPLLMWVTQITVFLPSCSPIWTCHLSICSFISLDPFLTFTSTSYPSSLIPQPDSIAAALGPPQRPPAGSLFLSLQSPLHFDPLPS